ncbi:MAG: NAD(P)-dependent oxidoreductase, partial [Candidatus Marinimicrobia bacterium]|nr:NAD(P)-dependent oxidoreductase [Candidatus Neomarinimicrobiota bacterium]
MKVAVTGASGFIGQHVLAELVKRNIEIIATSRTNKKGDCFGLKNIQWIKLDIESPPGDCYKILEMPDVLIHLAWGGLPNYRSLHHFDKELPIHYRFLSDLVNDGLQSLVSVGTCFEYGFQSGPIAANVETYPDNPYGLAKDTLHKQLRQ